MRWSLGTSDRVHGRWRGGGRWVLGGCLVDACLRALPVSCPPSAKSVGPVLGSGNKKDRILPHRVWAPLEGRGDPTQGGDQHGGGGDHHTVET